MIPSLIRLARRAVGLIAIALFVVLVGFSLFTHVAPLTGRELFIVGGGSMEPSIPIGSLMIATRTDPLAIGVGDVVTIRADNGVVVTHRIVRVVDLPEGRFFVLKGDANESQDAGLVPARAIVGKADLHIPYAGYAQHFLSTVPGMIAALSVLGVLLLGYMLLELLSADRRPTGAEAPEPLGP
jgi:signal peptidase I